MEKYGTAIQATDGNKIECMPDDSYRHMLRICNTYYFPTKTVVTRTLLSVALYVHFVSCFSSGFRYIPYQTHTAWHKYVVS